MWTRVLALAVLAAIWAFGPAALAADKPVIGPPEAWVRPTEIPKAKEDAGAAYRLLLSDEQVNFEPDGDAIYLERALRLQTTTALTAGGTLSLAWNPEDEVLTVHKVHIRRGDQIIDVLAKQSFTVLRRETNLQRAALDGVLTATIQVEGLEVGDVLDVAYTLKRRDPAMQGRSNLVIDWPRTAVDRANVRAIWTAPKAIQWKASGGIEAPKVSRRGAVTELTLAKDNLEPVHVPKGAPARFREGPQLELSEFKTWADVGALMTPLYDKASQLGPDSPLKAEAAKIRAASSDPRVQAAMALALVQKQVRYLFLGMKDGGYVPADADLTWERRFGDCKGKTVLLLALLRDLGIQAEPSLISTTNGDGLDQRLPTMGFFDHVMVRAQIAGKTYWMDGTRTSDRDLDSLKTPGFHWTLPERPAGAALIKLTPVASDQPDSVTTVRIDASAGLLAPATIHAEAWASGDSAEAMQQAFSALPAAERDKALRSAWEKSFPKLKITSSVGAMDEKTGVFKMTMDGSAPLEWDPPMSTGYKFLKFSDANLGWKPDYKRDPGPNIDAPYAVRYPAYNRYSLTLVLPRGGAGFAAPAPDVDVKVAGWALYRRSKIEKGVLTIEKSMKSLAPEFPASEADAAEKQLAELAKTQVFVRAPPGYVPTDADAALMAALEPKTAKEFIDRGDSYMQRRQYDKAIADFDKAIAADPKDSFGYSNRGIAHYWKGENDLAKADFAAAAKINGRDVVAVHGQGLLALRESRVPDAIAAFSRAVDLKENNSFALAYRAGAYLQIGDFDHALADLDELLRGDSTRVDTYLARADILRMKGDVAAALATLDDGLKANPGAEQIELHRAGLLAQTGKPAEAAKAFETLIKAHPSAQAYLTRARNREKIDVAGRLADVEAALKLDPKSGEALALRAEARADAGAAAQAVTELSEAMKTLKDDDQLLVARGKAYARSGDLKSADADLTRFAEKYAKNADALNEVCWTRATYGIDLKKALAECESSLALYPTSAAALDSRGFVLLRLGRYEEAVAAYAEALKLRPRQAESLYGRGLAELGLQRAKEGQADVAAARAISEKVVQEFADWGLKEAAAKAPAPKDATVKS